MRSPTAAGGRSWSRRVRRQTVLPNVPPSLPTRGRCSRPNTASRTTPCCDTRRLLVALLAVSSQGWGLTSSRCDRPLADLEAASDGCHHDEQQAKTPQPPARVTDYAAGDPPVH